MADGLLELVSPELPESEQRWDSANSKAFLDHLTSRSISDLTTDEPQSLSHSSQTILRSLQALSRRTYKSSVRSVEHLDHFRGSLPVVQHSSSAVQDALPSLEHASSRFSSKYAKSPDNPVLLKRQESLNLYENASRISDILDLPSLLSSIISSSSTNASQNTSRAGGIAQSASSIANTNISYASALDLHHHIKRLSTLFPESRLIASMTRDADNAMNMMSTHLLSSLRSPNLKLTAAMRTIGLLRRVAPELDSATSGLSSGLRRASDSTVKIQGLGGEGSLGAVLLVCRMACLLETLDALAPLRELADQETSTRKSRKSGEKTSEPQERWAEGQQTERYLKRYLEIFREQSFAIVSMYRNIFPGELPVPLTEHSKDGSESSPSKELEEGGDIPSALSTFPMHLVSMLMETIEEYLPNVQDRTSRESLLTQVLYCAGSLGRLGADFGMLLALMEEDSKTEPDDAAEVDEWEWVETVKKHRIQASRLELLASGVGASRQATTRA